MNLVFTYFRCRVVRSHPREPDQHCQVQRAQPVEWIAQQSVALPPQPSLSDKNNLGSHEEDRELVLLDYLLGRQRSQHAYMLRIIRFPLSLSHHAPARSRSERIGARRRRLTRSPVTPPCPPSAFGLGSFSVILSSSLTQGSHRHQHHQSII